MDAAAVKAFRGRYRERFEGQPAKSRVYREVSDGVAHGGIEYYLPLFFDETASLLVPRRNTPAARWPTTKTPSTCRPGCRRRFASRRAMRTPRSS